MYVLYYISHSIYVIQIIFHISPCYTGIACNPEDAKANRFSKITNLIALVFGIIMFCITTYVIYVTKFTIYNVLVLIASLYMIISHIITIDLYKMELVYNNQSFLLFDLFFK